MPNTCSICVRVDLATIEGHLSAGWTLAATAAEFGLSKSAIDRHRHRCQLRGTKLSPDMLTSSSVPRRIYEVATEALSRTAPPEPLSPKAPNPTKEAPSVADLLAFGKLLVAQAGLLSASRSDAPGMIRAAREARNMAAFDLATADDRQHALETERLDERERLIDQILSETLSPDPI